MYHLLSLVVAGAAAEDSDTLLENLTIIDFNYDRVFEHYFFNALQKSVAMSRDRAKAVLDALPIIRPYGSLGKLDWQSQGGIKFGAPASADVVRRAAQSIQTYTETVRSEVRSRIYEAFSTAAATIILGFGYHLQNMEVLGEGYVNDINSVFATVKGFHRDTLDVVHDRITKALSPPSLRTAPMTCRELMTDWRPLLSAAVDPR